MRFGMGTDQGLSPDGTKGKRGLRSDNRKFLDALLWMAGSGGDGSVWTSAGITASIDLALAMIEKDHGQDVARSVARKLVVYHRRAGGQSQFSALLDLEPKSDRIQRSINYAKANLQSALSVEELADAAGLSARQFSRAFRAETGQSPAKAVEHLRVEAARLMIEEGRHSMDVIAEETGFADRDRMRRAFRSDSRRKRSGEMRARARLHCETERKA